MLGAGFYMRYGGDTIWLGLPFIVTEKEIYDLAGALSETVSKLE